MYSYREKTAAHKCQCICIGKPAAKFQKEYYSLLSPLVICSFKKNNLFINKLALKLPSNIIFYIYFLHTYAVA